MAYTTDALSYRLNFTDGTFITLMNRESNTEPLNPGEYTFIIPNSIIGDFTGEIYTETKYDAEGNKYEFSERGVVINDTADFRATGARFKLSYNPVTGVIDAWKQSPPPELFPSINRSHLNESVTGICYHGDTSGTDYNSIGEAIVDGEHYYNGSNRGWYRITNVIGDGPFFTANTFFATHGTSTYFWDMIPGSPTSSMGGYNLNLNNLIEDYDPEPTIDPNDDPYDPNDDEGSNTGGGGGNHDNSSDDIDIPPLPTLSAVSTGFITLYRPDAAQLRALADYLWSSPLAIWDNVKKIVQQPMDCILGLSIVPVNPSVGAAQAITIADVSTGVNSYPVTSQYVEVPCGSITVNEYWGAYLDYEPYTKAEIYLPYIGTHPISIDDIMGKTITIVYHVDVLSGSCTAYIKCGRSVLYSFIGQCASSIPIGGKDWTNVITGALTIATAIGSMVAMGGSAAPMSGNATPQQIAHAENAHKAAMIRQAGSVASTAVNVLKPSIGKSGSMSGTGGLMAVQKPYLILTRPKQAIPGSQNHYMGYPSFITAIIGTLSGYTEVEEVHLNNIPATDNELAEIEELLRGGVYL